MAVPTNSELSATWRALSGSGTEEGWQFIAVSRLGPCTLHAGRRFPGNDEGLLVSFVGARLPGIRQLPKARGFEVTHVALPGAADTTSTIGLVREPQGSLELFTMIAQDIVTVLEGCRHMTAQEMLQAFLRRVTTWQEFMQRPGDQLLSSEAEVGLYGELLTLDLLLDAGIEPVPAVEGWQGPEDGVHDFVFGAGAIEVKTTVASTGFPAKIGSLDQLDDGDHKPLYLCGQRLGLDAEGDTLSLRVAQLRDRLSQSGALGRFEVKMLHAGYRDDHADSYLRRFSSLESRILLVDEDFPRLTPSIAGPVIRRATYEMDLDLVTAKPVPISTALAALGML
ncbi:PD-(D/E)XK motif protein [Sphingomonas prati]|uniref:PD-(D/E)XK motif protein n=1 Tax=Sphingomonas prati TaxID=1843237 RepID=A0A7W9F2K6_9SPHN|nr:PD-(D/E)XK motif protein [Sphingomonas prati]MBB5730622.1 hypothetical protein [Sphingomonas prati]GGE95487.1 hypothetical protein GCM10011404_30730 [Sphingomonas prati]